MQACLVWFLLIVFCEGSLDCKSSLRSIGNIGCAPDDSTIVDELEELETLCSSSSSTIWSSELEYSIVRLIQHGQWKTAQALVDFARSSQVDMAPAVRKAIGDMRVGMEALLVDIDSGGKLSIVRPAFQWAEALDAVFLNIKSAVRWSSPGAVKVENSQVSVNGNRIQFTATGQHSGTKKLFELNLNLFGEVHPTDFEVVLGSVGKVAVTLKKTTPGRWGRLLASTEAKPSNMGYWLEMGITYDNGDKRLIPEAEDNVSQPQSADSLENNRSASEQAEEGTGSIDASPVQPLVEMGGRRQLEPAIPATNQDKAPDHQQDGKAVSAMAETSTWVISWKYLAVGAGLCLVWFVAGRTNRRGSKVQEIKSTTGRNRREMILKTRIKGA